MKVLHYVPIFSAPSETFIYDLVTGLSAARDDTHVVLTHHRTLTAERPYPGVHVHDPAVGLIHKGLDRLFPRRRWNIRAGGELAAWIRGVSPGLIHCHFGTSGLRMRRLLGREKISIPLLIGFHGSDVNTVPRFDSFYRAGLEELGSDTSVHATVPSRFVEQKLLGLGFRASGVRVVPNAYNPVFGGAGSALMFTGEGPIKLITVGRLDSEKGHVFLLEALSLLRTVHPDIQLTVIGDGVLRARLERMARDSRLHVDFVGRVPHAKVAEAFRSHHLAVQPSIVNERFEEEGLCTAVMEALVAGIPVLATDIGGNRELLDAGESGFLVPQKDAEAIAAAVREFGRDPRGAFDRALRAQERARQKYSAVTCYDAIKSCYRELAGISA